MTADNEGTAEPRELPHSLPHLLYYGVDGNVRTEIVAWNGNVTGLVERLVESGHLDRRTSDSDRRVQVIRLTKAGRTEFRKMAAEHESWIADIFSDLTPKDVKELMRLLAKTKGSAQKSARRRSP